MMDATTLGKISAALDKFEPLVLYVFGSRARGLGRSDSDLDLAFLPGVPCNGYDVFVTAQAIADIVKCDVDLVDLSHASAVMRAQVVGTGQRLFVADARKAQEFEMYALSDYARANEERREVLIALGALQA
jgi:predicted nucleotidyltransferase